MTLDGTEGGNLTSIPPMFFHNPWNPKGGTKKKTTTTKLFK